MLAKSRSLITSPRARIFRLFTQTRYQGPNWLGLHACVTGVHALYRTASQDSTPTRASRCAWCARGTSTRRRSSAAGRRACGRPRRGAVAAVLPHWDDDDDRLPGGRLTRALPPRANGHDRGYTDCALAAACLSACLSVSFSVWLYAAFLSTKALGFTVESQLIGSGIALLVGGLLLDANLKNCQHGARRPELEPQGARRASASRPLVQRLHDSPDILMRDSRPPARKEAH